MTIRKKDGNLYILEGPNPIVKEQVHWDPDELVFHNFSWDDVTYSFERKKKAESPKNLPKSSAKTESPPKVKVEDPTTLPPAPEQTKDIPEGPREFDLPYIKYKVLCYCLPASTKVHVDKLYGESWQKTTYGKKFVFPCVVIESSDIALDFWTSDPDRKIDEKSIIYPFSYEVHNTATDSYDRVPYDEYRWWKVSEKQAKEGGWLFACVPSESHPDFSD